MQNPRDAETIQAYNKIIDDVTSSLEKHWENKGIDLRLLEKFRELWRYRALKSFNIPGMVEPEVFQKKNQKQSNQPSLDDVLHNLLSQIGVSTNQPKEEEAQNAAEDDDDGFSDADDDIALDEKSEESEDHVKDDDDDDVSEEESSTETDSEIENAVNPTIAKDQLICHYKSTKTKGKKSNQNFELSHMHFVIDGKPFFINTGHLTAKNNKSDK